MGEQSAGQNILLNGHALEMQGIVGHLILSIFQQLNHGKPSHFLGENY